MKIPHFPTYTRVAVLLQFLPELTGNELRSVMSTIKSLRGTPQNPVRWDNPDEWIDSRLSGDDVDVAKKIWQDSDGLINPRYVKDVYGMANKVDLVAEDVAGRFKLTEAGQDFLDNPGGQTWQCIDRNEGLASLLEIVLAKGPCPSGELLEDWVTFCHAKSNLRGDTVIRSFMWARLRNLLDRALIIRDGGNYAITAAGEEYLTLLNQDQPEDDHLQLSKLVKKLRQKQKDELRAKLEEIDPYLFEKLVKRLLEEMNYEDVVVTSPVNDKGVDVIGNVQVGITSVTEVIQVKRHRGNIHRKVLDLLRGSLHRFGAFRGTIITLGDFAKGAKDAAMEKSAAPITLINGEKLIELMLKYRVGVKKKDISYFLIDDSFFAELEHDEEE